MRKVSESGIPIMEVYRKVNNSRTWINESDFDPAKHVDADVADAEAKKPKTDKPPKEDKPKVDK